ncbi:MAG: zinc ribbon domain-containing protein [Deltaproteobacteria bacterium]|nr:zinc ribbon domain-containing protein [Deltaproteobacteria bacterium]
MGNANVKKCSSCGETMKLDAAFCTNCGSRFIENANAKKCSSCGEALALDAAFCTSCGSRFEGKETQSAGGGSPIGEQLMELANDFLSVREVIPARFEFSSQTGAQAPVQKVKIKYDAVVQLEPEKKQLTFWEKMMESSVGTNAGFFSETNVQKGIEVSKKIHGHLLFGGKYGFEYSKLREVVKAIAGEEGWKFKTVIFKPKMNTNTKGKYSNISLPDKKILLPALALLLIAVIGLTSYFYFSGRSKPTLSQTNYENGYPENSDNTGSLEPRVLQGDGTVAEGRPFIETDRDVYNYGEKIIVNYYNAPGYARDWICIVPAGSRNTAAGNYHYIPRGGRGVLIFKSPRRPGRYEARAYYSYSPFQYIVSARYGFTVN